MPSVPLLRASAAALLAVLALAGCGGDDASSDGGDAATTPASSETTAASTPGAEGNSGTGEGPSASAICDALATAVAGLDESAIPAAAQAQFAMALAGAYGDEVASMDGSDIDAKLKQTCPDIRGEALKRAGLDSFDQM